MAACFYILYSEKLDKFYVGGTEDLATRLKFHNNPIEPRKFTAKGIPWILKLSIDCTSKSEALIMEKRIKSMKSRKFIMSLIEDTQFRLKFLQTFRG
ncbi:MAG: GIY-YIG nuclease family protein [Flammeovirgaceae bacterium]|nr:GIY-YIG nuclease family protein [Flammeovirgaceae bacterium]